MSSTDDLAAPAAPSPAPAADDALCPARQRAAGPRLPDEPYPGLRPFLDHEAPLLQGRASQVQEVIRRLQDSRFVAVVGGSGSGKSSLIRAGVVPALRALGIPEAGDLWVPVVCTPGTVPLRLDSGTPQTPVTRLAWKLSQVLQPLAPQAAQRRRDEMAAMFRQGAGFARLVETYTPDLGTPMPQAGRARFLFVIDQFEELFHPNNHGNDDARTLIEEVISHFFAPHERCFVVLTMRSEHLADCAAWLNLPDAINRALYLVRRLSEQELRDAIVGPAKYYLRLRQRGAAAAPPGAVPPPDDVVFETAVIERLLDDVQQLHDDPDHLPLLQHVLARTWDSACAREQRKPSDVPAAVTWADLEHATAPRGLPDLPSPEPGWLRARRTLNVLRTSLDQWAQMRYEQRDGNGRRDLDIVLRHLAYRDPNNGLYFQQRLEVADPQLFPGDPDPRARLKELLEHGFLDEVNYLFWDREDPTRETLKVSHEAFIRGWCHFRALVDREAERFEEFLSVLRKCVHWLPRHDEAYLLEDGDLRRLDDAGLWPVFTEPAQRADWFRVLRHYRDGLRLGVTLPEIATYVLASRAHHEAQREAEAAQQRARRRLRNRWRAALVLTGVMGVLIVMAFWAASLQAQLFESIERHAKARSLSSRVPTFTTGDGSGARHLALLVQAYDLVSQAQQDAGFANSPNPVMRLSLKLSGLGDAQSLMTLISAEPLVNGRLRRLLTTSLWRSDTDPAKVESLLRWEPNSRPARCTVLQPPASLGSRRMPDTLDGTLFTDARAAASNELRRALFVTVDGFDDPARSLVSFYPVLRDEAGRCELGPSFWQVPRYLNPRVLIDARVRHLAFSQSGPQVEVPSVTLMRIQWTYDASDRISGAVIEPRSVSTDRTAIETFEKEFGESSALRGEPVLVKAVPTWREPGGWGFLAAGSAWRLFDDSAGPLPGELSTTTWHELGSPAEGGPCAVLKKALMRSATPQFESLVFAHGRYCVQISNGRPPSVPTAPGADASRGGTPSASQRRQVFVSLYEQAEPENLAGPDAPPPSAVATLMAFERRRPAPAGQPDRWMMGESGRYAGWIAVQRTINGRVQTWGAPLTTDALGVLAKKTLALSPVAGD